MIGENKQLKYQKKQDDERRAADAQRKETIRVGIRDIDSTFGRLLNPNAVATGVNDQPITAAEQALIDPRQAIFGGSYTRKELPDPQGLLGKPTYDIDYANSPFLQNLANSYMDFAAPEVNRQATKGGQKVAYQLARRGTSDSSMAGEQAAEAERQKGDAMARIASRAEEIKTRRAQDIERSRQSIVAQLQATGDSSAAANAAINSASNLSGSEDFEPLGQMFNVGLATGADVLNRQAQPFSKPTLFSSGKSGSSKVKV